VNCAQRLLGKITAIAVCSFAVAAGKAHPGTTENRAEWNEFPSDSRADAAFAPAVFRASLHLHRRIKRLIPPFPPCMTCQGNFRDQNGNQLDQATLCASLKLHQQGRHLVDLALKLNVLAVCAVFVFVGAILLGAF
jgi:hypothetical protein